METTPRRAACRRCHARKVKCRSSNGPQCDACHAGGTECVPHHKRRRNCGSPKDPHAPPPSLLPAAKNHVPRVQGSGDSPKDTTELWSEPPVEGYSASLPPQDQPVADSAMDDEGEDQSHGDRGASGGDNEAQRHLVEMLSQEDIDDRIIQKGVRIVYVGQEFSNLNYLISRQHTSHRLDSIPRDAFSLPPSAMVDELLANYFRLVNPCFPIIDEELFMGQYQSRDPEDPPSLLVLQAVLLVGTHVSRNRPDRDELKGTFFRRAKMLFDARFEYNRDVVVQAALLMTWHSEGVEDVGANSYHWVSIAARTAFGLGMHRDCGSSTLVAQDRRIWRRLWWILVQFDVFVTLSYGRPQAIHLDDTDVPQLAAEDFAGLDGNVDADLVIHQSQLCTIISTVLRQRFGLHRSSAQKMAALAQADQQLALWKANLPSSLGLERPGVSWSSLSALLHINYNTFLILLHRPSPRMTATVNPDDMEICSSAASTLVSLFEKLWRQDELRKLNVFSVNALFTTLIQTSAEMRVKNPILGANATARFDTAMEVLNSLSEFWLINAGIVQKLFEDGSGRIQQQLQIGKSVTRTDREPFSTPLIDSYALGTQSTTERPQWSVAEISQPGSGQDAPQQSGEEALDWSFLYWENSGFDFLDSSNGDLGLYQPT